jgi:hypothetical protein
VLVRDHNDAEFEEFGELLGANMHNAIVEMLLHLFARQGTATKDHFSIIATD